MVSDPASVSRRAGGDLQTDDWLGRTDSTWPEEAGRRVAVVDIGSNSIRLVVFDGLHRIALPIFNEKVFCGLGRGLLGSGRLSAEGVETALPNLVRFVRLAEAMRVGTIKLFATAAVRDASNGPDFVSALERACGYKVDILSGQEEARLSALGVLSSIHDANGLMGDLGGGSLELVEIRNGRVGRSATLPLGPLRLMEACNGERGRARKVIERELDAVDWLKEEAWDTFYPVGGTWRSLARLHIEQEDYALHVIHGYSIPRDQLLGLTNLIAGLGRRSLSGIRSVSARRIESLPWGAVVLGRLVRRIKCKQAVFSASGLREGVLFDALPAEEQARDPLIEMAASLGRRHGRFGSLGDRLCDWTDVLFPEETLQQRRLRLASCHLSDCAWQEHPDYRAIQALRRILYHPLLDIDHAGRCFMAYSAYVRYGGGDLPQEAPMGLLDQEASERARLLGLALRLAYRVSGAIGSLLDRARLSLDNGKLVLILPGDASLPTGHAVERRLVQLAKALGVESSEVICDDSV